MTMQPLVSIGLPTYNRAQSLREALKSLSSQDYENIEIIVSNNASVDDTETVIAEWSARDSRIKRISQSTSVPVYDNFMAVFHAASADYFMWAADDDEWEPTFVTELMSVHTAHPDVLLVMSEYDIHNHALGTI